MDNRDIGRALHEMSLFLEMAGVQFKPRAFEKAALAVEALDRPVETMWREGGAKEMTKRVVRAIENPNVDVLFHPSARQLGRRAPIDVDMDAVIEAAARTGTVLEIDAQPDRLDLADAQVRRARDAGVKLAIDSDAHNPGDLRFPREYGVFVARRGWARRGDVVTALPVEKMLRALKPRLVRPHRRAV
ncbi:MAG: hypothetical protein ACXW5U_30385 [Thermoanaerobaculia bacterium]